MRLPSGQPKFNSMKNRTLHQISILLLILLWVYASASKLLDFQTSKAQMLSQVFPVWISRIMVWAVPVSELVTAGLLLIRQTERAGLYASLYLLSAFTCYIALILTGLFGTIPCSCGGVLEQMTWVQHLFFNLFFLALTLVAIVYLPKSQNGYPSGLILSKKGGAMRKVE